MCKPIHSSQEEELLLVVSNKPTTTTSLIEEIGGKGQLSFVLIHFCEYIQEDTELQILFQHTIGMKQLDSMMSNLVNAAFFDTNSNNNNNHDNMIIMKNYAFFEVGMNKRHFEKFQSHFEAALRNCWIDETLIQECTLCFGSFLQSILLFDIIDHDDGQHVGAALRNTARSRRVLA